MLNPITDPYLSVRGDALREAFTSNGERVGKYALLEDLKRLRKRLNDGDMYRLLEKSEIELPRPLLVPRNPELEARVQRLRKLQDARQYRSMTRNVDTSWARPPEDSIGYQVREMNRQLIGVLQILVSISTGFLFGFLGIELIVGTLPLGTRIMLGIFASIVVAIAEFYFFIKKIDGHSFDKKNS